MVGHGRDACLGWRAARAFWCLRVPTRVCVRALRAVPRAPHLPATLLHVPHRLPLCLRCLPLLPPYLRHHLPARTPATHHRYLLHTLPTYLPTYHDTTWMVGQMKDARDGVVVPDTIKCWFCCTPYPRTATYRLPAQHMVVWNLWSVTLRSAVYCLLRALP